MAFVIKTNIARATDVLIRDMGLLVPRSGGSVTFDDIRDLESVRLSRDLLILTTDNAFGPGSSTLIVNDNLRDVPQDFSEGEIREASLGDTQHTNILMHLASSGVLQGGIITRNGNIAKFDISDGYGRIVNSYSDPRNPSYAIVTWSGKTAITVTNLASSDYSFILIDINNNVVQQTSAPTPDQTRDYVVLGALVHPTRSFISTVVNNQVMGYDPELHFVDFTSSFGPFNIDGNVFSANGANLYIDRASGKIFKYGANYATSAKSPNIVLTNPATRSLLTYVYQTAPGVWVSTAPTLSIDPNRYDTGFGLTGVSAGNWTIQPIFMFAETSSVQIEYGQVQYTDKTAALARINDPFNIATQVATAVFRGWIAVAQGTTGLNDTSNAVFVPAGKFGLVSSTSGGANGEINTASNIGNRGIGWYVQKLGVDLQFKNLYAASNKISVTDTPGQHSVDVDVASANIDHDTLGNVIGGETGYHYHLSTIEYNWVHANPTGIQGFTGAQGYTGIQGYTGVDGVTGFQGVTGVEGVTGIQGVTGAIGATGLVGVTGVHGVTGVSGVIGVSGVTGVIGITGLVGVTGVRGITGVAGETGILGDVGYTGSQGNTGLIGLTGAQGYAGDKGATGAQGYYGFTGLPGVTGFQGSTGIQGLVGETGAGGPGVATGGVTGQFLMKASSTDFSTVWHTITPADVSADPSGSADALKPRIANALSSGLLYGGKISINTNPTLFDIEAGFGLYVNSTSYPSNPTYAVVSWAGMTGISSPYIGNEDSTYIAIDSTASVVMQPNYFSNLDLPDLIVLGWVDHTNRSTITYSLTEPYLAANVGVQMQTFFEALGAFNISGNEYSANGNNLKLDKNAGSTFDNGTNYESSNKSPNIIESDSATGINLQYFYRTGFGVWKNDSPVVSLIDPNQYDVGVGLTGIPAGKFTIQTITFYAPTDSTDIQYGQALYDTLEDAGAALNKPYEQNPYNSFDTFRTWLLIQQGCTGLNSATQCAVVNAGRYGLISGRYGTGGAGEANTASNVGLFGVGLFNAKSGVDLQFKNIDAGSNKIEISNDTPNKTVEVDVLPQNIDHDTLGNVLGGETGYHYHLDTIEYNWINANPTGVRGYTGAQGLSGAQGINGTFGSTGLSGLTGVSGVTGSQGLTGLYGQTGIQGTTGIIGVTGSQGLTGLQGLTGISGTTGIIGLTGSQGATGTAGTAGNWNIILNGNGNVVVTGSQGYIQSSKSLTVTGWSVVANVTGSISLDILKGTYASFPPSNSMIGYTGISPNLSGQISNTGTVNNWITNVVNANDVVSINVNSVSTVTLATLILACT